MFGVAVARLDALTERQKTRYHSLYCGLCRILDERYGRKARMTLSYDLTFLAMLYDSLFEPPEKEGWMRCASHPKEGVRFVTSPFTTYCADLSVALAYNKCLDDVVDEKTLRAKVARAALARDYRLARSRIPEQCHVIESATAATFGIESMGLDSPLDSASLAFGDMLGFLFECHPAQGISQDLMMPGLMWGAELRAFGEALGRFIYMMDAAVDYREDLKRGSYNPFVNMRRMSCAQQHALERPDVEQMREVLSVLASSAVDAFERMPLVQDVEIMRCVLYSGVWQKFNLEYRKDGDSWGKGESPTNGKPARRPRSSAGYVRVQTS